MCRRFDPVSSHHFFKSLKGGFVLSGIEKFESDLKRLESIVGEMEKEGLGLERSMQLFQEGIKISQGCRKSLEQAEQKVKQLTREGQEVDASY